VLPERPAGKLAKLPVSVAEKRWLAQLAKPIRGMVRSPELAAWQALEVSEAEAQKDC
jgi:hypothetical protein